MINLYSSFIYDLKDNKFFFLFFLLPTLLIPFFLITGPFLPDLAVSISGIYIIFQIFFLKKYEYLNFPVINIFFIFCLYIFTLSFFSFDVYLSLTETIFYVRFGFFTIFIYFILKKYDNFIKYFTATFLLTFIIVFIDAYIQYFFGYNTIGNVYNGYRLNSFFGSELKLGSYIARLTPILIGLILFLYKDTLLSKIFLVLIIINSSIIVLLAGERIAFFLLIFYLLTFFILSNIRLINKFLIIIIILPTLTFILFNNETVKHRMIDTTINQILNTNNLDYTFLSRSHSDTYKTAFNMFLDKPLFGVGVKNFRILCSDPKYFAEFGIVNRANAKHVYLDARETQLVNDYGCFTHPHNNYIQLLAETGVFGFAFIVLFFSIIFIILIKQFFYLFIPSKKKYILKNYELSFYLAVLLTLFPFIPSGNLFNNWLSIIYFLPIGFIFYFRSLR
tara:strand:+ start:32421 stop:33764 length:1344 start_codon:yes stop_codon:yes gene_type:complete